MLNIGMKFIIGTNIGKLKPDKQSLFCCFADVADVESEKIHPP